MINNLPNYVVPVFLGCVVYSLFFIFYWIRRSNAPPARVLFWSGLVLVWATLQSILAYSGFFQNFEMPPRFAMALLVPLIIIVILLWKCKDSLEKLPLQSLTWIHIVRIPVEFVLYWLFLAEVVPDYVTFEGRNFDIISGITAPLVALFLLVPSRKRILLWWNFAALILLINVVVHAILAAPTPFQQIAFDQPNTGVMYFPFILLPAIVVPTVMFSHFIVILRLLKKK